jgi:hypothetical protein
VNKLSDRPWHVLNVDVTGAINKEFDFNELITDAPTYLLRPYTGETLQQLFAPEWLAYMAELGILPDSATIFYRSPFFVEPNAHIDLFQNPIRPAAYALNWVVNTDDDSEMIWFDTPDTTGEYMLYDPSEIGSGNMSWPMTEFANKPIYRRTLGTKLTLLTTGWPHNVIVNKTPRWCISLRYSTRTFNIQSWDEAIAQFNKFIVTELV